MKLRITPHDPLTLMFAGLLTVLGLFFAFDAGFARSLEAGHGAMPAEFATQVLFLPIALIFGEVCARVPGDRFRKFASLLWIACLAMLVMALVPPFKHAMNGAERWIRVTGSLQFQPAEFAKLGAIVYLAATFCKRAAWPKKTRPVRPFGLWLDTVGWPKFKRWLPALFVIVGIGLIEREPDLGTGLVIGASGFAIAAAGGATRRSLAFGVASVILLCGIVCVAQPYRWTRIVNHFQRWDQKNMDDSGYQTVQSEIAMASGGFDGVGSGRGHAKHLMPATTTDFVMATVSEEFGFVGAGTVLALLAGLVVRLLYRAAATKDRFAMLTVTGVATWIGFQGCVNMLQANGTLPPIGIPFPFVSSGGSSLIALWASLGVVQSVCARKRALPHAVVQEGTIEADSDRRRDGRTRLSRA